MGKPHQPFHLYPPLHPSALKNDGSFRKRNNRVITKLSLTRGGHCKDELGRNCSSAVQSRALCLHAGAREGRAHTHLVPPS